MAVLRAFQAADMRADLGFGIPVSLGRFEIVIEDIARTTTFLGDFSFPRLDAVNAPWYVWDDPFLPFEPSVEGTLFGYERARLGFLEYQVQGLDQDAFAAFFALFRLDDTQFFQALVFAGDDVFFGSRRADVLLGYAGSDQLWGMDGDDALAGGRGSDTLYGLDDADVLRGAGGRDWLWGGDDGDRLLGGEGRDRMEGQAGADTLTGGLDQDVLRGGSGADSFRYLALADSRPGSSRRDIIRDFGDGRDVIDLRPLDAVLEDRGNDSFTFIGEARFTGTPGELRFAPGPRLIQGDTDGDGRADVEIELGGSAVPAADDFLL